MNIRTAPETPLRGLAIYPPLERRKEYVMKILVVDDDMMITRLISMKLGEKGYEVEKAYGGWEALKRLSSDHYDLLITDLMMPDMSGIALISMLKNYVFGKVHVIIISSLDQSTTILSGMGLGAEDYFIKPFDINKLIRKVERILPTHA